MRIGLKRVLDYWIGIPVCFCLSLFNKLIKFIGLGITRDEKITRIMFVEFSELGSAILAYPAIKQIQKNYPGAEVYFWIFQKNKGGIEVLNVIPPGNIIAMRSDNIFVLIIDIMRNLFSIRKKKIDTVIDMELFSRFSAILSYLSGTRNRVGFNKLSLEGLYRGNFHTHKVSYNPYLHISKNFLSLVFSLEESKKEFPHLKKPLGDCEIMLPKINSDGMMKEKIWQKLKAANNQISPEKVGRIVILNPGINETLTLRKWPLENYAALAKKMLADPLVLIVLIGEKYDSYHNGTILQYFGDPNIINLVGKTTIEELLALYNTASLFISHDGGAVNLAALTDINIIALFGPETPVLYEPLTFNKKIFYANLACSPCLTAYNHRRSLCKNNKCLQLITVDEIYNAALNFFGEEGR